MSVKKYITFAIILAIIVGSFLVGGLFNFIDMIIVRPITNILFIIYNYVGDFGLAIILFTIVVKFCMWPLVKKQFHQTKLMRKLQPELTKIKKNCNGNRQLESLQTMDLYKRYNVKPFRSILTLFIQLPIFIALFTAIRVMVQPRPDDNLSIRAYPGISSMEKIDSVIKLQEPYLADLQNDEIPAEEKSQYDFHPQLFGLVDLDVKPGFNSASAIAILCIALAAALVQYINTKQQNPTGKSEKKKKFRDLIKEASNGKDPDQADMNVMMTNSMSKFMPIMMLMIMINLQGALVLYYFLTNLITVVQQKIIFAKSGEDMEIATDKAVVKELNKIQEAKVIENKKTGTKITRISAKDNKRRKK
ncbi:membrane protein insertase YidC [Candidatus Saccharibacteria bacterium]|nr:membrane protein insertase YidC [Candidatus Saccharibacteria bacterium]